jgi:chromosome partitioning protein
MRGARGAVDVLPADPGYRAPATSPRAHALAEALAGLTERYDLIVFDTPPAADLPLVAALAAAHFVLTPTQLTPLACEGVMRFSQVFFYAATQLNPDLRAFAIAPTQVDLRTRVQQAALARLKADFGPARLFPAIRSDVTLAEAFGCGLSVRDFRPHSRGAGDYAELADWVETEWFKRAPPRRADVSEAPIPRSLPAAPISYAQRSMAELGPRPL